MPSLNLDDSELQNAAQACRIARQQSLTDAAKQANPGTREIFETIAKRYRELSEKLEQARKGVICSR